MPKYSVMQVKVENGVITNLAELMEGVDFYMMKMKENLPMGLKCCCCKKVLEQLDRNLLRTCTSKLYFALTLPEKASFEEYGFYCDKCCPSRNLKVLSTYQFDFVRRVWATDLDIVSMLGANEWLCSFNCGARFVAYVTEIDIENLTKNKTFFLASNDYQALIKMPMGDKTMVMQNQRERYDVKLRFISVCGTSSGQFQASRYTVLEKAE